MLRKHIYGEKTKSAQREIARNFQHFPTSDVIVSKALDNMWFRLYKPKIIGAISRKIVFFFTSCIYKKQLEILNSAKLFVQTLVTLNSIVG